MSNKTIQINEIGKVEIGGIEIPDKDFGKELLSSFYLEDSICFSNLKDEKIYVEAKTFPLVVKSIKNQDGKIILNYNYDYSETYDDLPKLYLDDWSRICGYSKNQVPFLFSSSAQFEFLEKIVEPLSYNTFKFENKEYELDEWYHENSDVNDAGYWENRYQNADTPWDERGFHPAVEKVVPRLKLNKSKILVPGCGTGNDAVKLASLGHVVHGIDSSESAIEEAKKKKSDVVFSCEDFFSYAQKNYEAFDIIFEHTFFCALSPEKRSSIINSWKKLLKPGGHLMGVFMVGLKQGGPPFGATEWEIKELLEKHFKIDYWGRLRSQESLRPGKELFVYAQRK